MRAVYVFRLNKHSSNYNVGLTKATLRWDDADISENVTSKVDLYFLNPQRNLYCLTSLTLPNVGGLFSSCIPTISNFTKRKKALRGLFTSSTKCETSHHTATLKKCIKMVCCSAGLLLWKIKLLLFWHSHCHCHHWILRSLKCQCFLWDIRIKSVWITLLVKHFKAIWNKNTCVETGVLILLEVISTEFT